MNSPNIQRSLTLISRRTAQIGLLLIGVCLMSACSASDDAQEASPTQNPSPTIPEARSMKIRLTINGETSTATLEDNPSARDFLNMLPMTLTLDDYNATEKIAYLPRKLSTQGAPAGIDPEVGDITYYAPWGNVAFFYRDFGYSSGLIRLGHFDSGVNALHVQGSVNIRIEVVNP